MLYKVLEFMQRPRVSTVSLSSQGPCAHTRPLIVYKFRECVKRLVAYISKEYYRIFKNENSKFMNAVQFIISKNILCGDATSLKLPNCDDPIVFSEWSFVGDSKVKRTEYTLANLVSYQPFEGDSLFSDLGEEAFIPKALRTFKLSHYFDLNDE